MCLTRFIFACGTLYGTCLDPIRRPLLANAYYYKVLYDTE